MDGGGFILSRRVTHASEGEGKAVDGMLKDLPVLPDSLAADTAYRAGSLRKQLEDLNIKGVHTTPSETGKEYGLKGRLHLPGRSPPLSRG